MTSKDLEDRTGDRTQLGQLSEPTNMPLPYSVIEKTHMKFPVFRVCCFSFGGNGTQSLLHVRQGLYHLATNFAFFIFRQVLTKLLRWAAPEFMTLQPQFNSWDYKPVPSCLVSELRSLTFSSKHANQQEFPRRICFLKVLFIFSNTLPKKDPCSLSGISLSVCYPAL